MTSPASKFHLSSAGPWFAILLALAMITFWPTYVSLPREASSFYTHFHALIATCWLLLLIIQPWLIRRGNYARHRQLGQLAWLVGPVFILSILLLANYRIKGLEGPAYEMQTFILWLQLSLGSVFALSWVLAMLKRDSMVHHARFMICTGLTLIDPILIRALLWMDKTPDWNYWWLTFGLTDLVLVVLIFLERNLSGGRGVFPAMLVVFFLSQSPALFGWTSQAWWQGFAAWYASLPLT
jgi:uncharacterized membrane protein YozB (DUF420 family)